MAAVLLTGDLALMSKFAAAGARTGAIVRTAMNPAALVDLAADATLAVIDLGTAGLDVAHLTSQLKALTAPPRVVAFGPHVQEALLAGAKAAGCDEVLTRGQFHARMDELLREET